MNEGMSACELIDWETKQGQLTPALYYGIAKAYEMTNNDVLALLNYEKALEIEPENNLYLNDTVIKSVLCKVNSFKNFTELAINFDNNCQNIDQLEKYV